MNSSIGIEKIVFIREAMQALTPGRRGRGIGLATGLHVAGVGDHDLLLAPDHAPHVQEHGETEQDPGGDADAGERLHEVGLVAPR